MTNPAAFSKGDADRILRRAAEIEGTEDQRPLTIDELRFIAGEAGFGTDAVERAIAEAREAGHPARRPPVQKWGLFVTHVVAIREIPFEIGSEEIMQAVRLFQPYRDGPAQVKLEEREITWRDRKKLRFSVTSSGGVTEIRVRVDKVLLRKGRWMGWVRSAADRLETLLRMVATQELPGPPDPPG